LIASLANPLLESPQRLVMGLSGGLDSRVLLAVLQERKRQPFSLFLFGHPDEPDVQIASRIAQEERLEQQFFSELNPLPANTIDFLREFVLQTQLTSPASLWQKLRFYSALHDDNAVVIDGAFGEIARRQFMNRALKRARSLLRNARTDRLLPYVATHRANIFTDAVHQQMVHGVALQLAKAWERMPRIQDIGAEKFADLLIVRYRYPNYAGWGQASMDHEIVSYMPFIQPSYVDAAFSLPMQLKRNGLFYRHIIRTCRPALARFPLVKGTTTYPFWMTTVPAWAFTKLKTLMGRSFNDPLPALLLEQMKEFVLDTVASSSVRTYDAYDHRRIASHVERFYRGDAGMAREVDWWLSFELWRQAFSGQRT
jgi:asparagine synthetase B (glutamine-hydrolysing)